MFFDDKKYKNKIDLGNKKVESKEEFLKKLREEKQNELKKSKQIENNLKIKRFLSLVKKKICPQEILQKTLKNLKTTKALLEHKKDLDAATVEKIVENTFEKLKEDLVKIYRWNAKGTEELTQIFIFLLQKFSFDKFLAFFVSNENLVSNIFVNSLIHLYVLVKKDYLLDEKLSFFAVNKMIQGLKNYEIYSFFFKTLARKDSLFYFLNTILKSSKKLISDETRKIVMNAVIELNQFAKFSEKKIYQIFFENSLKFILNFKEIYNPAAKVIFGVLSKCTSDVMMKYFSEADFTFIVNNISEEILNKDIRDFYLNIPQHPGKGVLVNEKNLLNLFEMFFYSFRKIDFKSTKDKSNILKCINTLLEFVFEFYSRIEKPKPLSNTENTILNNTLNNYNNNNNLFSNFNENQNNNLIEIDNRSSFNNSKSQNLNLNLPINYSNNSNINSNNTANLNYNINSDSISPQENFRSLINVELTEKLVLIIYQSSKLIKKLYEHSFDNSNLISLLDFIVNKQLVKINEGIIDSILLFSLKFLDFKNEKINIHTFNMKDLNRILQIISFCVYSKIEYRENFFFIEFKNSWNIYQNIPFNYVYLNNLTKLLIHAFSYLINKKDLENIEKLTDNVIIHCLKSLYNLDSEIQFSQSKDNFWSNMELISKIQKFSQKKLIQSMKIMPFIFPFVFRLTFLNNHLKTLRKSMQSNNQNVYNQYNNDSDEEEAYYNRNISFAVKRNKIFEETFALYIENKLRPFAKWTVTFINEFGMKEEGVDAGGLFKEFMFKLSEEAFSPKYGFFIESNLGFLMPNAKSEKVSDIHLKVFEFLGFIVGVALIEDIKIWPNFNTFFLNNILGIENSFIELKNLDPEYFKNLVNLKNYQGDIENDFGLNFTIDDEEEKGVVKTIELIKDGANVNVTQNNKLFYIRRVAKYKLTDSVLGQCESFKNGILKVIDEEALKLFTSDEMRQLITGFDKEIDVNDMKLNTNYVTFNFNDSKDIKAVEDFWEILYEMDSREKEKLLFFVTSLKRPPIVGFKGLHPKFTIYKSDKSVPTSSTCGNILFLPILPKNKMRDILRYVINADSGFYYG